MTTNGRQESKSTASTDSEEGRFGLKRREMLLAGSAIAAASALGTGFAPRAAHAQSGSPQTSGMRKSASSATKSANDALLKELPFSDKSDFENAHKGFIEALPSASIKGHAGNVIWDPGKYGFIREGASAPDTVNPSLWRQSQLINISGLFQVADGIYQVRNQDLSNMTIIEGEKGIVVVDPLVSAETAKVAINFTIRTAARRRSRP